MRNGKHSKSYGFSNVSTGENVFSIECGIAHVFYGYKLFFNFSQNLANGQALLKLAKLQKISPSYDLSFASTLNKKSDFKAPFALQLLLI